MYPIEECFLQLLREIKEVKFVARKRKIPDKIVDYESLSSELKNLYDKFYSAFDKKNIYLLREQAAQMSVESPTTLSKDDLVKRMTDRLISDYLPNKRDELNSLNMMKESLTGERVRGIFEKHGGEYHVGHVLVPAVVAKEAGLREGDMIEGVVSDVAGSKTLVVVNSIEGEMAINREWFAALTPAARRPFGSLILGTKAAAILPELNTGERVIISGMTKEMAKDIIESFPNGIGLLAGLEPEFESMPERGCFSIPFEASKAEALHIAHLALERAKRLCERGRDVVLVVYGFDSLGDRDTERAIFGAGRSFRNGSLTVITDLDKDKDCGVFAKIATRII